MITLGTITFDSNAFADAVSLAGGSPFNMNFDGLLGSSNQSVADIGTSNNSPDIKVSFTDNIIINGEGADVFIYVPGEVFAVEVSLTAEFAPDTTMQASAVAAESVVFFDDSPGNPFDFNPNSILLALDLSDLGIAEGDGVSILYLQRGDIEGGIYGVGALNSEAINPIEPTRNDDVLIGTKYDDVINALRGDDVVQGKGGDDILKGGKGKDTLLGGKGNDDLGGGKGSDILEGGRGVDTLVGNSGKDTLNGGRGNDSLTGGGKADMFEFGIGFGNDTITDFAASNFEKIDLSNVSSIRDFDDLLANHLSTDTDTGFAMIIAGKNSIVLEGYVEGDIDASGTVSADDFIF
ncbi:MAG: hypothetical protein ABJP33_19640 [Pseudoruegeria sp.]